MAREEFNRDMGDYLRRRNVIKRTNPLAAAHNFFTKSFSFKIKEDKEELPLDIPQEQIEAVLAQDAIKQSTSKRPLAGKPQVVTLPTQPQKTQEKKPMGWLFNKKKEQDEDYDTMETVTMPAPGALDEDVKEVLKITFKWLKQMDPDQVEEIKSSSDFEKYKKVLDKYGLIKK